MCNYLINRRACSFIMRMYALSVLVIHKILVEFYSIRLITFYETQ